MTLRKTLRALALENLESRRLMAYSVAEHPFPFSNYSVPNGLVADQSGTFWLSDYQSGTVHSFNPQTQVTHNYTLPAGSVTPTTMIFAPDGDLWVADFVGNHGSFATINPSSGEVTQLSVSIDPLNPYASSFDPDLAFDRSGKLWFNNLGSFVSKTLYSYDPATQSLATFSVPTASDSISSVASGPDGSIWFTESGPKPRIATIDLATNQFTEFSLSTSSDDLILGPDGNFWYFTSLGASAGLGTFNLTTHQFVTYAIQFAGNSIGIGPGNSIIYNSVATAQLGVFDIANKRASLIEIPEDALHSAQIMASGPNGQNWFLAVTARNDSSNPLVSNLDQLQIVPAPTISLTTSNSAPVYSIPVTYTATVKSIGGEPATGLVQFYDGNVPVATLPLDALGNATYTTDQLNYGSHQIKAFYLGDSHNGQVISNVIDQTINPFETFTTLTADRTAISFGDTIHLTATVRDVSGNPLTSGTLALYNEQGVLLTSLNVTGYELKMSFPEYLPGTRHFIAVYQPVEGGVFGSTRHIVLVYAGSAATPLAVSIAAAPTSVILASSANTQSSGSPITLTATVDQAMQGFAPDGSVTFYNGSVALGTIPLNDAHTAMLTTSALPAGTQSISAVYDGGLFYKSTASNTVTETVIGKVPGVAPSKITLSTSTNSIALGGNYVLTATVAASQSGATTPTPTGNVDLYEDGTLIGKMPVDRLAQAHFQLNAAGTIGTHLFTASYEGNSTYATADSNLVSETQTSPGGPQVTSVTSSELTTIIVHFSEPLDRHSAENVNNYVILAASNSKVRVFVKSATYNFADSSVTLRLKSPLTAGKRYQLAVVGTGSAAVVDTSGVALDGNGSHIPGSNFVTKITPHKLAPAGPKKFVKR